MTTDARPSEEQWSTQMDEMRDLAGKTARQSALLGRLTARFLGFTRKHDAEDEDDWEDDDWDDPDITEIVSSAESAERWASMAEGPGGERTLAEYFEGTRNALNEAVWILDHIRKVLDKRRPSMVGEAPDWVGEPAIPGTPLYDLLQGWTRPDPPE